MTGLTIIRGWRVYTVRVHIFRGGQRIESYWTFIVLYCEFVFAICDICMELITRLFPHL